MPGIVSEHLRRDTVTARPDYQQQLLKHEFTYYDEATIEWSNCESQPYWNDEGMVTLSAEAEKEIMEATFQLHNMCLEVVRRVVED